MAFSNVAKMMLPRKAIGAEDWHTTDPWVAFGMKIVVLLGCALMALSLLPIAGAVVSSGTVSVEGEYKAVQHLEGGIVSEILVKNGDHVEQGDVLVRLDGTQAKAMSSAVSSKVADHAIQEARLSAERDRKESFALPEGLDAADPDVAKTLAAQQLLFETRRAAYLGQLKVLNQRLVQSENDLKGVESQFTARQQERALNAKELATVMPLYEKGFVNQQRIGPLQREAVRLEGEIGNLKSELAKLKAARAEAEARLAQADKEYSQQAASELEKVQMLLSEERESLKSASDKLTRIEVKAPVAGVVHALAVHTQGGVVPPGGAILQIVPTGREFVVEAHIAPKDIDSVHMGQPASVRFTAFDSHTTPRLKGKVRKVSAAELSDKEGRAFFSVEVAVTPEEVAKIGSKDRLVPGMPAEVYLETPSRTVLSYFMKPFTDMMARSFRER